MAGGDRVAALVIVAMVERSTRVDVLAPLLALLNGETGAVAIEVLAVPVVTAPANRRPPSRIYAGCAKRQRRAER